VGILLKPLAVPPKSEVDAKKYNYHPCPLDGEPQITSRHLPAFPQLYSTRCEKSLAPEVPTETDSPILGFAGDVTYGWGIHIIEGPNYFMICTGNISCTTFRGLLGLQDGLLL